MGDWLHIFKTNAPKELLEELEKSSCEAYINGGDDEDVPIWADVVSSKGYSMLVVDSHQHITPFKTSKEWLEEHEIGASITEHYVIENQPDITGKGE